MFVFICFQLRRTYQRLELKHLNHCKYISLYIDGETVSRGAEEGD